MEFHQFQSFILESHPTFSIFIDIHPVRSHFIENTHHPTAHANITSSYPIKTISSSISMSSSTQNQRSDNDSNETCAICDSNIIPDEGYKLDCGHRWCFNCMQRSMVTGIEDISVLPIRCCHQNIPKKSLNEWGKNLLDREDQKLLSRHLKALKIVCSECKEFYHFSVKKGYMNRIAECDQCGHIECRWCHYPHNSIDDHCTCTGIDQDEEITLCQEVYLTKCQACGHYIERTQGCNNMTCICGHNFCYICLAEPDQCSCPKSCAEREVPVGYLPGEYRFDDDENADTD